MVEVNALLFDRPISSEQGFSANMGMGPRLLFIFCDSKLCGDRTLIKIYTYLRIRPRMTVCWHEDIFRGSTMDRIVLVSYCKTAWKRPASNVSVGKAETYIDNMRQKRTAHRGETMPYPRPGL